MSKLVHSNLLVAGLQREAEQQEEDDFHLEEVRGSHSTKVTLLVFQKNVYYYIHRLKQW